MTIAERLHEAGRKDGQREGFQEGHQEGRQEEALRIARTMLENGIARDTILEITGLSAEKLVAHGI